MVIDKDDIEATMLGALLTPGDLVPDGLVIESHARSCLVTAGTYRSVIVRPHDVDPDTFTFGDPGAYARISVEDGAIFRYQAVETAYMVSVFASRVSYSVQSMGRVIGFTDPGDAIRTAVFQIHDHIETDRRREGR